MLRRLGLLLLLFATVLCAPAGGVQAAQPIPTLDLFFKAAAADERTAAAALAFFWGESWRLGGGRETVITLRGWRPLRARPETTRLGRGAGRGKPARRDQWSGPWPG